MAASRGWTKTQSEFGVQLDSLADVVSFGAAPAVLLYRWSLFELGFVGLFIGFVYVACGALRLARFNVLASREPGSSKHLVDPNPPRGRHRRRPRDVELPLRQPGARRRARRGHGDVHARAADGVGHPLPHVQGS